MKKIISTLLIISLLCSQVFAYQEWIDKTIDNKKVKIIKVIPDKRHSIITSVSFKWDTLNTLVKKVGWVSWITWAYFCPADYGKRCNRTNSTTADRIFEGKSFSKYWPDTWGRWMFWFDKNWEFIYLQNNLWYAKDSFVRKYNVEKVDQIYYWLSNHPVLLIDWENVLSKEWDILLDKKMLKPWPKNFICTTQDKKTFYMWQISNISMYEVPYYLTQNFWCRYALNLDSGPSSGIIYNWSTKIKDKRQIMDAFVIYENPDYKYLNNKEIDQIRNSLDEYITKIRGQFWTYKFLMNKLKLIDNFENKLKNQNDWKIRAIIAEIINILNSIE